MFPGLAPQAGPDTRFAWVGPAGCMTPVWQATGISCWPVPR